MYIHIGSVWCALELGFEYDDAHLQPFTQFCM